MPDKGIFCNTPWYELHVYWDGSLGICCQEDHKLYPENERYNIATTSIQDWFNSQPVKQFRSDILRSNRLSVCRRCYVEEDHAGHSRRLKSNAKSVIFTKQAFDQSFLQSPGYDHFMHSQDNQGHAQNLPIDLHIDLGNYCNLACKMCNPRASSTIAAQQVKWGIESSRQYLGNDWTKDARVWQRFMEQLLEIPHLKNIHFMGGETLLTGRLEQLVDWFIQHQRYDVCFSFVTNGTIYPHELMIKMSKFGRLGIEVSIETMTAHNEYLRQGTSNALVMRNLESFSQWDNGDNITVTLRSAPSILSVGYYHTLLDYAIQNQMVVKSNLCSRPSFMRAELLPESVKRLYLEKLDAWAASIDWPAGDITDFNASDPHNVLMIVRNELEMIRSCLSKAQPEDTEDQLQQLVDHCKKWDKIYGLNARTIYPEFKHLLDRHGYDL